MKKIIVFITLFAFFETASAQSVTATIQYQKADRQAVIIEIPFAEKTIMNAIDNKMELMGYKGKGSKGFTVYKGVKMPELGNDDYDLYFMADKKNRKDKDNSTLTLMIAKGEENFVSDISNAVLIANAKKYLNNIHILISTYYLEQQIIAQEETVNKAFKNYNNLVDEGQGLEKKRSNIEKDIESNKKEQVNQQTDLEKQKQILETLKSSRKQ